jgi:hypothetical protein
MNAPANESPFYTAFRGNFTSLLSWEQLDDFWAVLRASVDDGWYVYAVGEPVPEQPSGAEQVNRFIDEVNALLHREHEEDYCGIVYTDSKSSPTLIKIFDPNNLGVQCGYSDNPPLPGWVLSRMAPCDLRQRAPLARNRKRWWQKLLLSTG